MKFHLKAWRALTLLALLTLIFGLFATATADAAPATGFVRLGNLSEARTPVDIYLFQAGSPAPSGPTLADVAYGTVQQVFQPVTAGAYTVQIRDAGAAASSAPFASLSVTVKAGKSYTVAPLEVQGQGANRHVVAIEDPIAPPAGAAFVTVVNAAAKQGHVTFHCSCGKGAKGDVQANATPGTVTAGAKIPPGAWTMTATGSAAGAKGSTDVNLLANTSRTEIVIDAGSSLEVVDLLDSVGSQPAVGGVGTGLGGTAPHGPGSPLPWLVLIVGGALVALGGGFRLLRRRAGRG